MNLLRSRGIIVSIMLFGMLLMAQVALAELVIISAEFTCSSLALQYDNDDSEGDDDGSVTIVNINTKEIIFSSGPFEFSSFGGSYDIDFDEQPEGSELRVRVEVGSRSDEASAECESDDDDGDGDGDGEPPVIGEEPEEDDDDGEEFIPPQCTDERINRYNCEPVAIYPIRTETGYGMAVYRNIPDGDGTWLFYVSPEQLAAVTPSPSEPVLIAASPDGFAELYWLPSNEWQVVAGPDHEGKMFKFIFDVFPGQEPRLFTYFG